LIVPQYDFFQDTHIPSAAPVMQADIVKTDAVDATGCDQDGFGSTGR